MLVTVVATEALVHEGHARERGDHFQTTVIDALRLRGQGKISLSLRPGWCSRASTPDEPLRQADVTPLSTPNLDAQLDTQFSFDEVETPDASDTPITPSADSHNLEPDDTEATPRRRRGRRSYKRAEVDVGETTELDAER